MSKFDSLKPSVLAIRKENPTWGSDKIAEFLVSRDSLNVSVSSLSRHIRRKKWLLKIPFSQAKVLLFDIETAPMLSYHWGLWNQNIQQSNVVKPSCMITWSAKWLFEEEVFNFKVTPEEIVERDDKRITLALWDMLDESDIVIAHNLNGFDRKVANQRFLKYNLPPPSFYETIDTLTHSRRQFKHPSNRLDDICSFLGIEGKMETPKGLWQQAVEGSQEAIDIMAEYCDQDVRILEDVYLAMRPYIKPHPNIGLLESGKGYKCPSCGHTEHEFAGEYRTYVNVYDNLRCKSCGSLSRSRVANTPKEVRDSLLVSNPK